MRWSNQAAIALLLLINLAATADIGAAGPRGVILSDFESGVVDLRSYPDQDQQPNSWELTDQNTYDGSLYSLRIYGNSWKLQAIDPYPIHRETVLRVAVHVEEIGEMQAFGISDGTNRLLYTLSGTQLPTEEQWEVAYQGSFPIQVWNVYYLPVGRDWDTRYGYEPVIDDLVYINDRDNTNDGVTLFDDVIDVTEDLPVPPEATILRGRQEVTRVSDRLFRVGIQFHAQVYDPDSDTFSYHWDFGDSSFSEEIDPFHDFLVEADHTYTVTLGVEDEIGLWGRDSAQVAVEPGGPEGPVTMNFAGDVMLARRYEYPGEVIDLYGVEAIFVPTLPFFGTAADISVCNLESPLTDEGDPHPTKSYVFRGHPENVAGLTYAGVDVVSLGNNHIVDFGQRGMEETQEVLDAAEIRWSGAGDNEYFARQPTTWTEDGVAIAFLGQCNRTGREWNYQPFLDAAYNKPGFSYLIEPNLSESIQAVRDLVDLVVIQLHAGSEYSTGPGNLLGLPVELPLDAVGPTPEMVDFTFPTRPSLSDRQLRWRAVEAGADLVICHHPHVLQGFEVYQGVVIAHSMGNFAFDQSFAETFPSMILSTELDKTGFLSYTFRPVFIDDMIPRPATGRLGREILDRLADYSRELATTVTVNPVSLTGTIHTDPEMVVWNDSVEERTVPVFAEDGAWISIPIPRDGLGTLSEILSIEGTGQVDVRVGRELLWHGDFENEGANLWNLNSVDEQYDESTVQAGLRSLRQHRDPQNQGPVTTDLKGNLPTLGSLEYSLSGWIRTENARDVGIWARFYENRSGGALESLSSAEPISGTSDWMWTTRNLHAPEGTAYFNVRLFAERPESGDGYSWFDGVRLVEWEEWEPADLPLAIPYPNNFRFLQVRLSGAADSVTVAWEEKSPDGIASGAPDPLDWTGAGRDPLRIQPNPVKSRTSIAYLLSQPGRVKVELYDINGRRVALLEDGEQTAGRHRLRWDAAHLSAGIYFCRLETADGVASRKLVRLK